MINGCANITGGGLKDNIKRVIPENLVAEIDLNKIKALNIFKWLKNNGLSEKEMLKTFNCGIGMTLIIKEEDIYTVKNILDQLNEKFFILGKIIDSRGPSCVEFINDSME